MSAAHNNQLILISKATIFPVQTLQHQSTKRLVSKRALTWWKSRSLFGGDPDRLLLWTRARTTQRTNIIICREKTIIITTKKCIIESYKRTLWMWEVARSTAHWAFSPSSPPPALATPPDTPPLRSLAAKTHSCPINNRIVSPAGTIQLKTGPVTGRGWGGGFRRFRAPRTSVKAECEFFGVQMKTCVYGLNS